MKSNTLLSLIGLFSGILLVSGSGLVEPFSWVTAIGIPAEKHAVIGAVLGFIALGVYLVISGISPKTYFLVGLASIVVLSLVFMSFTPEFWKSPWYWALAIPVCVVGGVLARQLDRAKP